MPLSQSRGDSPQCGPLKLSGPSPRYSGTRVEPNFAFATRRLVLNRDDLVLQSVLHGIWQHVRVAGSAEGKNSACTVHRSAQRASTTLLCLNDFQFCCDVAMFAGPVLLEQLVNFVSDGNTDPLLNGCVRHRPDSAS